jgi:hypothetical protein
MNFRVVPVLMLAAGLAVASSARADVVTEWNENADGMTALPPAFKNRIMAMVHVAVHDALNSIDPRETHDASPHMMARVWDRACLISQGRRLSSPAGRAASDARWRSDWPMPAPTSWSLVDVRMPFTTPRQPSKHWAGARCG